jgi:hypothetical protein
MTKKVVVILTLALILVTLGVGKSMRDHYLVLNDAFSITKEEEFGIIGSKSDQLNHSVSTTVNIYPDSVINDVSNHPIGINLDYFMDGDRYKNPSRNLADALKEMGVKYLWYPGGDKSDSLLRMETWGANGIVGPIALNLHLLLKAWCIMQQPTWYWGLKPNQKQSANPRLKAGVTGDQPITNSVTNM